MSSFVELFVFCADANSEKHHPSIAPNESPMILGQMYSQLHGFVYRTENVLSALTGYPCGFCSSLEEVVNSLHKQLRPYRHLELIERVLQNAIGVKRVNLSKHIVEINCCRLFCCQHKLNASHRLETPQDEPTCLDFFNTIIRPGC